jgi:hypothetical protein
MLASYGESACCKRCQQRRQRPAMVEYYGVAAVLHKPSIPEDLTDNELDEVLNAKTS